jgi:hypothetical protein
VELETQRKIVDMVYRMYSDLAEAFNYEDRSYEAIIQFIQPKIQEYGNRTLSAALMDWANKIYPIEDPSMRLRPEDFGEYLKLVDTKEKAEALLLSMPEPEPQTAVAMIAACRTLLPTIRQAVLPFMKRLPHPPGGRPKKLTDPSKRQAIRDEIGLLLAQGVALKDAQKRIADREDVGLSTIQKVWRENRSPRKRKELQ